MKRVLKNSPNLLVHNSKTFVVVKHYGGRGTIAGLGYRDGIFLDGLPLPAQMVAKIRSGGFMVAWFLWEPNIKVRIDPKTGSPEAWVEDLSVRSHKPRPRRDR